MFKEKKLAVSAFILAVLVVGVFLAVIASRQSTENRQHASGILNLNTGSQITSTNNYDGTMGPATWYGNFSNTLPQGELGTLTFAVTDPPQEGRPGGFPSYANVDRSGNNGGRPSSLPTSAQGSGAGQPQQGQANATRSSRQSNYGPQTVTSLVLKVTKVEVHLAYLGTAGVQRPKASPQGGRPSSTSVPQNGQPADHWETLNIQTPVSIDLVKLANGGVSMLGLTKLAAGRYTEVRLYVSNSTATLENGTSVTLTIPGKNNIVRIVQPFIIIAGQNTSLTMAFDAQHSVIAAGNGEYILKPVVARLTESR